MLSRELLSHMFEPGPGGQPPRVLACARWHAYPRWAGHAAEHSTQRTGTGPQLMPLHAVTPKDMETYCKASRMYYRVRSQSRCPADMCTHLMWGPGKGTKPSPSTRQTVLSCLFPCVCHTDPLAPLLRGPHRYKPPERFSPFALAPGLLYGNALEAAASAMEMAAVAGRNSALLALQHLRARRRAAAEAAEAEAEAEL